MHLEIEFEYILPFNLIVSVTASCEILEGDYFQGPEMRDFKISINPEIDEALKGKPFTRFAVDFEAEKKTLELIAERKLWDSYEEKQERKFPDDYLKVDSL